jgi:hypothetical protein
LLKVTFVFPSACNVVLAPNVLDRFFKNSVLETQYSAILNRLVCFMKTINKFLYVYYELLTLILLTWRIWWARNNASRWQMGFNSTFKGLIRCYKHTGSKTNKLQRISGGIVCVVLQNRLMSFPVLFSKDEGKYILVHTMRAHGGGELQLHFFLTSALNGIEKFSSHPRWFTLGGIARNTH